MDIFLHNVENTACWRLLRPCPFFFLSRKQVKLYKKSAAIWRKVEIMKVLSRKFDLVKKRGGVGFLAEDVGHRY